MSFLRIIEILLVFLFIITMFIQVIVPLWNNLPIFPLFNKSRKDLERDLKILHELEEQQKLADEVQRRTDKLLNPKIED